MVSVLGMLQLISFFFILVFLIFLEADFYFIAGYEEHDRAELTVQITTAFLTLL